MDSKEICTIREWAPLHVLEILPHTISVLWNLNLTCVSAVDGFLALGCDAGVVFWYNRHSGTLQKLKAEWSTRITCVSIVDSVEYMVAAGHSSGQLSIFQIKKELPPDLDVDFVHPSMRAKPVERYTIVHGKNAITCCAWSKNAMKLYSGDCQGVVVLTEIDYQARLCNSVEILSEAYEIVQLSVHQCHLLVCTLYRTVICICSPKGQWQITQVGQKDRKQLVDCGGIFLKRQTENKRPLLICGRPRLRFWIADMDGNVEKTLLFRDAVTHSPTWEIPILNPKTIPYVHQLPFAPLLIGASMNLSFSENGDAPPKNFSALHSYAGQDSLVVTHDGATLYILNLDRLRVEAMARGFRKILDFCVCGKEIFVLEGERSLLRLAPLPEKPNKTAKIIFNPLMPPPVPTVVGAFEAPIEYAPEEDAVIRAEECFELPPIEALTLNNIPIELAVESPRAEQNRRLEIFQHIPEVDVDQPILHHSYCSNGRKQKKNRGAKALTKSQGIVEIAQPADAGEESKGAKSKRPTKLTVTTQPTLMDASFCTSAYVQHLPDVLSPNTLQRTIAAKNETLAEMLRLPVVHLAPITDEELHQAKAFTALPTSIPPFDSTTPNNSTENLLREIDLTLAIDAQFVDDAIQERKKSDAEIETIYEPWPIMTNLGLHPEMELDAPQSAIANFPKLENISRNMQNTKTNELSNIDAENAEIESFLLDFRRAGDPLLPALQLSADSNPSNGWDDDDDDDGEDNSL